MKHKTHSGTKKRIKVRKSGTATVEKAGRRHLLVNKSKGQKRKGRTPYAISPSRMTALRRLLPGKGIRIVNKATEEVAEVTEEATKS